MIEVRKFETLGGANHGWLNAKHHFSFADYHDPDRTQWGKLRVWNDDEIQPKSGFPPQRRRHSPNGARRARCRSPAPSPSSASPTAMWSPPRPSSRASPIA